MAFLPHRGQVWCGRDTGGTLHVEARSMAWDGGDLEDVAANDKMFGLECHQVACQAHPDRVAGIRLTVHPERTAARPSAESAEKPRTVNSIESGST